MTVVQTDKELTAFAQSLALEEAAMIAEKVGRECHYGPIDTNHSGADTGRRIAEAIRAHAERGKRAAKGLTNEHL